LEKIDHLKLELKYINEKIELLGDLDVVDLLETEGNIITTNEHQKDISKLKKEKEIIEEELKKINTEGL
jgi:hypothetical protein